MASRARMKKEGYIYSSSSEESEVSTSKRREESPEEAKTDTHEKPDLPALLRQARQMTNSDVSKMVPTDVNGQPTSVGAFMHPYYCKPCTNPIGKCKLGVKCRYCHFVDGHVKRAPQRLTKKERMYIKDWKISVENEIRLSPTSIDIETLEFPEVSIRTPGLKDELVTYFMQVREEALSAGVSGVSGSSRGAAGAERASR